jgi:hypothetical protein
MDDFFVPSQATAPVTDDAPVASQRGKWIPSRGIAASGIPSQALFIPEHEVSNFCFYESELQPL